MIVKNRSLILPGGALRAVLVAILVLAALAGGVALKAGSAAAHGNPEISVEPNPADAGGDVTITGEGFEEEDEVSLVLEGVLGETSLGTVTTDSEGAFSTSVTLPEAAGAGSYRIRAAGADDVAIADVRIQEAEGSTAPPAAHEAPIGFHDIDAAGEVAGFAVLAAVLVLVGAALLWFPRGERHA
jgi:5'-nucleotidase